MAKQSHPKPLHIQTTTVGESAEALKDSLMKIIDLSGANTQSARECFNDETLMSGECRKTTVALYRGKIKVGTLHVGSASAIRVNCNGVEYDQKPMVFITSESQHGGVFIYFDPKNLEKIAGIKVISDGYNDLIDAARTITETSGSASHGTDKPVEPDSIDIFSAHELKKFLFSPENFGLTVRLLMFQEYARSALEALQGVKS